MEVQAKIWDMANGQIVTIKIGDQLFRVDGSPTPEIKIGKKHKQTGRTPAIKQWIEKNKVTEFRLEDFFKDHPYQKRQSGRLEYQLSKLIKDGELLQLENDRFKVVKG